MLILNNYLPGDVFSQLQSYCIESIFKEESVGEKIFCLAPVPELFLSFFQISGCDIQHAFIRKSNSTYDTELNIHSDGSIFGKKIALAGVFYIKSDSPSATAFWSHKELGDSLPPETTDQEFDHILHQRNDREKWNINVVVPAIPNRYLLYNSSQFHSKYPQFLKKERIVIVIFYTKK